MKFLLVLTTTILVLGCVKKVPGVDETNHNIFDADYDGDQWFDILGGKEVEDNSGVLKFRVDVNIPKENLPNLKPTGFPLAYRLEGQSAWTYRTAAVNEEGGYTFSIDYNLQSTNIYCVDIGIQDKDKEVVINNFVECVM